MRLIMNINQSEAQVVHQLIKYKKLVVAFSGGLDSTVLLHLLVQLRQQHTKLQLRAVHVHHGLSAFSDSWVEHCKRQCISWNIALTVQRAKVEARSIGIEAAARKARYRALKSALNVNEVLITAQHIDDQSETFLLALKRGSGPAGLSAMPERGRLTDHLLLRPLLNVSRLWIKEYAQKNHLSWIEDESNKNLRFDRNFLRLKVLPLLRHRWPHFASAVARCAKLCAEQEQLLDELLRDQLPNLLSEDNSLEIDRLLNHSKIHRFYLLRRWITLHGVTLPSRKQLQNLWDEVALSRRDASPCLVLGCYQIRRFRSRLYLLPRMENLRNLRLYWSRIMPLVLPDGLGRLISNKKGVRLRAPKSTQEVIVRFGTSGGRVRIVGRVHSRSIKKLWRELGVPPWMRERTPLIYYDQTLIAALGVFVCEEWQSKGQEDSWRVYWDKNHNFKNL